MFLLFILCLCSSIKTAAKLISSAADFLSERKRVLLIPVFLCLVFCVFFLWWLLSFVYLFSVGDLRHDSGDIFGDMTWKPYIQAGVYLMGFSLLWFISFIISTNIFVVSAMCSSWYFNRKVSTLDVKNAFRWAWIYHIGSLALGSFLIALLWAV